MSLLFWAENSLCLQSWLVLKWLPSLSSGAAQSQRIPTSLWIKTLIFDVSSSELLLLCCQRDWALPKALHMTRLSAYSASPGNPLTNVSETVESKGRERNSINNNKWVLFSSEKPEGRACQQLAMWCIMASQYVIIRHWIAENSNY